MPDRAEGGTGDATTGIGGLTVPLGVHVAELRKADKEFNAERDRRYAEVNLEREKALKIKETADLAALELAREIQTYKDEKANELRSQIERERGTYVTQSDLKGAVEKLEAMLAPLSEYVTASRASRLTNEKHQEQFQPWMIWAAGAVVSILIGLVVIGVGAFT